MMTYPLAKSQLEIVKEQTAKGEFTTRLQTILTSVLTDFDFLPETRAMADELTPLAMDILNACQDESEKFRDTFGTPLAIIEDTADRIIRKLDDIE